MRTGILGGTFNPIHRGHLHIAEHARTRLKLDHIIFIPTGDPPHKAAETLAPAHHRLEMVKLATNDSPHFQVSDIESSSSQTNYTIDTLHALKSQIEGELYFLIGLDAFLDLPTWKASNQLLDETNFIVLSRPETQFSQIKSLPMLPSIPDEELEALDNGAKDLFDIATSGNTTLTLLALPPCEISASTIRERLRKGLGVDDCLPPTIESYIIKNQLYDAEQGV